MENIITKNSTFSIVNDPDTGTPMIQVVNILSIDDLNSILSYFSGQVSGIQKEANDISDLVSVIKQGVDLYNNSLPPANP